MHHHRTPVEIVALALLLTLAGCSSVQRPPAAKVQPEGAKPPQKSRVVGQASPLDITGSVTATLVGSPPAPGAWILTDVAMATDRIGWAAGKGLGGFARPYMALDTTDGGRTFSLLFTAAKPIVAVAAPDVDHAFFLEQTCVNGGGCASELQAWQSGERQPVTLWESKTDAAFALSFPTAQDGYIATADTMPPPGEPTAPLSTALYATHDGGKRFEQLKLPCGDWNPSAPGAMDFFSADAGWLVCGGTIAVPGGSPADETQQKSLYATEDAGRHWRLISQSSTAAAPGSLPQTGLVDALYVAGPEVGYVGLDASGVYRTDDAGKTWRRVFQGADPAGNWARSLGFGPGGYGWLLAGPGPLLHITSDGGQTWRALGNVAPLAPQDATWDLGPSEAISYALPAGYRGTPTAPELITSSDGGAHWTKLSALPFWLQHLDVLSSRDLVASDDQAHAAYVEESSDGGQHWSRIPLPKGWQVWGTGYYAKGEGWVLATYRYTDFGVFRCENGRCTRMETPFKPGPVQMTGPSEGLILGQDVQGRTALFSTRDGGRTWRESVLPAGDSFSKVGAKGMLRWLYADNAMPPPMTPMNGSAESPASAVLLSRDGGRKWQQIDLPAGPQAVASLSFRDPLHGLLVTISVLTGTSCWETNDGGRTFHLM